MQAQAFPNCCGIEIVSQFGNTNIAIDRTEYTRDDIKKFLKDRENIQKDINPFTGGNNVFIMATLNNEQFDKIGDIFIEEGYEVLAKNEHIKHNSIIYILVKALKY
jgi:hypothetical protein